MKVKKLLALVLSAVMAMTMLAACGGGGDVKTVSVDRREVEELYADAGYEIDVTTSSIATTAAKQVAEMITERDLGAVTQDFLSTELSRYLPQGSVGMYLFSPKADMEATVEAFVVGTIWSLYSAGYGDSYGVVVVEVTTADDVPCYLSVAIAQ